MTSNPESGCAFRHLHECPAELFHTAMPVSQSIHFAPQACAESGNSFSSVRASCQVG